MEVTSSDFAVHLERFRSNLDKVRRLMNFDQRFLEFSESMLKEMKDSLPASGIALKYQNKLTALVNMFINPRTQASLREDYRAINNQCVVLLVSYLGAALEDLYLAFLPSALRNGLAKKVLERELKGFTVADLLAFPASSDERLIELVRRKTKESSFQDMQSIRKVFESNFGCEFKRDIRENDISLAQAGRHIIVHAGAVVSPRFLYQVESAVPRSLRPKPKKGEVFDFRPEEIETMMSVMDEFMEDIVCQMQITFSRRSRMAQG